MASGRENSVEHLPEQIGRYQILGLLGTGGMAEILLARLYGPSGFERPVVIKRILPHLAREQRFHDMFLDEARIVAGIRHQNVVHVHELGQEGGELYLVMEYLEGESASSLARRLASHRKLLNFGLCAHLMAEVSAGLHAAHELKDLSGVSKGLVHRDVSPANVFITYAGEVKMIDFGIATAADRVSRTEAGQVKGKYAYMSPEQCMGLPLDRRSDIFSMGTVLYELSTCRRLFKRQSDMLTLQAICHEEVLPPSELVPEYPKALERICLRALAKKPDERYSTTLEMRRDLLEVARDLNGSKVPEESLAKVMRRLFPDRIEEKRLMLNKLRLGQNLTNLPATDIDDSVELEEVQGEMQAVSMLQSVSVSAQTPLPAGTPPPGTSEVQTRAHTPEPVPALQRSDTSTGAGIAFDEPSVSAVVNLTLRAHRRRSMLLALVAALLVLVSGAFAFQTLRDASARANANGGLALGRSDRVELRVVTEPAGAQVHFQGLGRGTTPVTFEVDRSDMEGQLRVVLEGHVPLEDRIVPNSDQLLRLILMKETSSKAGSEVAGAAEKLDSPTVKPVARKRTFVKPSTTKRSTGIVRTDDGGESSKGVTPKPATKPEPDQASPEPEKVLEDNPYSRFN